MKNPRPPLFHGKIGMNYAGGFAKFNPSYGFKVVFEHINRKHLKNSDAYILARTARAEQFSMNRIEKIVAHHYYKTMHQKLNFTNPISFTEKIQWMKIFDATPLKTRLADKFLVRDYVKERIGEKYLVPILGVWTNFDDIDFDRLPRQFVLKLNSGCGMNIVVKDKNKLDIANARRRFSYWMQTNFAYHHFEMQYRDISRKIIAEEYLEQPNGGLYDYKVHCFGGKAYCVQLMGDRDFNKHTGKEVFLDLDYNKMQLDLGNYCA